MAGDITISLTELRYEGALSFRSGIPRRALRRRLRACDRPASGESADAEASERLDRAVSGRRLLSPIVMQASELASDILAVTPLWDEAHGKIVTAWRQEEAAIGTEVILKISGRQADNADARRLFSHTKALYLFVRAYHDALYGVVFELVTGRPAGNRRMQSAVDRPQNPVGKVIREHMPEYLDWFPRYRAQRNAIKDGVGFSTVGPTKNWVSRSQISVRLVVCTCHFMRRTSFA